MLARNQINATIDHRSFADQGITEQPTIHEGYIAQNMEKKGMIADRCEINRQIRADNKMLRELKAKVAKLAEAVEKSIPIIAETLEVIRNHMIFTQYHLLHNDKCPSSSRTISRTLGFLCTGKIASTSGCASSTLFKARYTWRIGSPRFSRRWVVIRISR